MESEVTKVRRRKYDRVSRMDRERRRGVRRRVIAWVKWAAVLLGSAAFALALRWWSAGGFTWQDTAYVFMDAVVLWYLLETAGSWALDYFRGAMRARRREKVLTRRTERKNEIIKMKG